MFESVLLLGYRIDFLLQFLQNYSRSACIERLCLSQGNRRSPISTCIVYIVPARYPSYQKIGGYTSFPINESGLQEGYEDMIFSPFLISSYIIK